MSWSQEPQGGPPGGRRNVNPPPVCFTCNEPGHFVVDCPKGQRANPPVYPAPPVQQYQAQPPQPYYPQNVPSQTPYHAQGPYPPTYQQYGPPAQQTYAQTPVPQPYVNTQANGQYNQPGYQQPAYNQYQPPPTAQQYPSPAYANPPYGHGPPNPASYPNQQTNFAPTVNGFNHGYAPGPNAPFPHQPQWSNSQAPINAPPQQNANRSRSQSSGFPQFSPNQQRSHLSNQQRGQRSKSRQTSAHGSFSEAPQNARRYSQMPYGDNSTATDTRQRSYSLQSTVEKEVKVERSPSVTVQLSPATIEGTPDSTSDEEQFEWDFEKIFQEEVGESEFVALAQTLCRSFDESPVPQLDESSRKSVSRFISKNNLKEYMLPIRGTHRWSDAKEDPAFAVLNLSNETVLIEELAAWIAARQGFQLSTDRSRKRSRSAEQEEEISDPDFASGEGVEDIRTSKRQKNATSEEVNDIMTDNPNQTGLTTPGLSPTMQIRDRTPCVGVGTGDAWAPEPGEVGAPSSPAHIDEALLASLGVSGDVKPTESEPQHTIDTGVDLDHETTATQQHQQPEINVEPSHTPSNQQAQEPQRSTQDFAPYQTPQQGPPAPTGYDHAQNSQQYNQGHQQPHQQQFALSRSASWSNGPQGYSQNDAPYNQSFQNGVPPNAQYQAVPPPYTPNYPQRSASFPNTQHGHPQFGTALPPNVQSGHVNGPGPHGLYAGQPQYGNGAPQGQYASAPYQNPQHAQYPNSGPQGPQHWGPPQYNNVTAGHQEYQNRPPAHHSYVNPSHKQPQYQGGPPSQSLYGSQSHVQYNSGPGFQQQPGYQQPAPPQHPGIPPNQQQHNSYQQAPSPYGNQQMPQQYPQQQGPNRQDSGYMSARGSYSAWSGDQDYYAQPNTSHGDPNSVDQTPQDGGKIPNNNKPEEMKPEHEQVQPDVVPPNHERSKSASDDEELSPTSMELLGKFDPRIPPASKQNRERKTRVSKVDVDPAFSRRWG